MERRLDTFPPAHIPHKAVALIQTKWTHGARTGITRNETQAFLTSPRGIAQDHNSVHDREGGVKLHQTDAPPEVVRPSLDRCSTPPRLFA